MKNTQDNIKKELAVLHSGSLRGIVEKVNSINADDTKQDILKDDIVSLTQNVDGFFLLYFK